MALNLYDSFSISDVQSFAAIASNADTTIYAQTFTPPTTHYISQIQIKGYKVDTPTSATISIKATSSNLPTGSDLTSGAIDVAGVTTDDEVGEWISVNVSPLQLTGATMYAVVLAVVGTGSGQINWIGNVGSSPSYASGTHCYSTDSGDNWTSSSTRDQTFKDYGVLSAYPLRALTRTTGLCHHFVAGNTMFGNADYSMSVYLGGLANLPQFDPYASVDTRANPLDPTRAWSLGGVNPITGDPGRGLPPFKLDQLDLFPKAPKITPPQQLDPLHGAGIFEIDAAPGLPAPPNPPNTGLSSSEEFDLG